MIERTNAAGRGAILLAALLLALAIAPASAQTVAPSCDAGLPGLPVGAPSHLATDANGRLCLANLPQGGGGLGSPSFDAAGNMRVTLGTQANTVIQGSKWYVGDESVVSVSLTTATTPYAAGRVLGGVASFPVFRLTSGAGILAKIAVSFSAPITPPLTAYLFEAAPSASTDGAAPTFTAADWASLVDVYSIVPYIPTGAAMSIGSIDLKVPVKNRDTTATKNLYAVVVTESPVTVPANAARVTMRVSQD